MRGRKSGLLNLRKVIFGVLVERESTKAAERDFALRPDFGQIKDVPAEFFGLFGAEGLHVACP